MLDEQAGPLRKKQKLSNVQLPNLVPPETVSLFETLANECVRHIAFQINGQFYQDARHNLGGWKTIGENKEYIRSAPARILGLDVETIATVNNKRQLARLSVVELVFGADNAAPGFKTVLDVYVDPGDDVVEYRTNVSGISEELLNSKRANKELKTFTEAQAMLVELGNNLGGANVYLVGHALINDLKATKVVPFVQKQCVIDTAYLYSYEGVPFKSVGLKLVMDHVLNAEVQKGDHGHSSVEDAISALRLVLNSIEALKECRPRKASIPLELAPWYSTLQVFSILESHRDEAYAYLQRIVKGVLVEFYKTNEDKSASIEHKVEAFFEKNWIPSSKVDNALAESGNKGNRYYVKIQLPSAAVALQVWKQLGQGDGKTHIMLDAEGFWLKKVNVAKRNDSNNIASFMVRMYVNRAKISIAEQGERRKGSRGRAEKYRSIQWHRAKKDMKHRSQKRGRRCAVCNVHLVDSDYVRSVAHGSGRFMHTSATKCAANLHLCEKRINKKGT